MEEFTPTEEVQKDTESKMAPILESVMGIKPEPTPESEVVQDDVQENIPKNEDVIREGQKVQARRLGAIDTDPKPLFTPEEISTAKAPEPTANSVK